MTSRPHQAAVTVSSGVRAASLRTPQKVAVIDGDRRVTFAQLVDRMDRFSSAAGALGLGRGDHVAVISPNAVEYFDVVLGLAQAGIVPVHLSPKSSAHDVEYVCRDAGVRTLFVHESLTDLVAGLDLPGVEHVVVLGDPAYDRWLEAADPTPPTVEQHDTDLFCLFYTSGTTGRPKGVLLSHRSRVLNYFGMASEYGCFGPDDHALSVVPMCHGAGLTFAVAPVFFGGTTTVHRSFDPQETMEALRSGDVTNVFVVPTVLQRILALGDEERGKAPRGLRRIISNAAALPYPLKERTIEFFGPGLLFECYGSTEGGIVCNIGPDDQLTRPGSVGRAFPTTLVQVLDGDGRPVAPGEVGELYCSTPAMFSGYLHVPWEETPGMRDGWFTAGDLARQDEDGYVYIVGRRDDKIITGGLNVYPREIEDVLMAHPAVEDAIVYGVPDETWGESVVAAVTLHAGAVVTQEELRSTCAAALARYKIPKELVVVPAMPRNATGKILRRDVPALADRQKVGTHAS